MRLRSGTLRSLGFIPAAALVFLAAFLCLPSGLSPESRAWAGTGRGWESWAPPYGAAEIRSVSAIDARTAWAVGGAGLILKTVDGGATWSAQPSGTAENLHGVSAIDARTAWAVGGAGLILKTVDGGATWSAQPSGTAENLHGVSAIDARTAWAVGGAGLILKTVDGGATWSARPSGTAENLRGVSAVSAEVAWALGVGGVILRTVDGGANWQRSYGGQSGICAIDASNAWSVGSEYVQVGHPAFPLYEYRGAIYRTINGGLSWTRQYCDVAAGSLASIAAVSPNTAWAVGKRSYGEALILKTDTAGVSWSMQNAGTVSQLNAVEAVDAATAWAVGEMGTITKTSDGVNWTHQSAALAGDVGEVIAVSADTVWAVSDWRRHGMVYRSGDGGRTFPARFQSTIRLFGLDAVDSNLAWAVGTSGTQGRIYRTSDAGSYWTWFESNATPFLVDISAADQNVVWAVGANGAILYSHNAGLPWGVSWTLQNSGTTRHLPGVHAVNASTAWAVGEGGTILRTDNAGSTWYAQNSGTGRWLLEIHAVDANVAWAVGEGGVVLKTVNGGSTWSPQASPATENLNSVYAVDANVAWAVGDGGMIIKTTDGGTTWRRQDSGTAAKLNSVNALDACTAWVAGDGGAVLKTTNGGDDLPDIASMSPATASSGAVVTIRGSDFGAARNSSGVSFGGVDALEYVTWSDNEIKAKVPALPAGAVTVRVTTPRGTSNGMTLTVVDAAPPAVASVAPNAAPQFTWAVNLQVTGTGFRPGAEVRLEKGAVTLNAYNVNVVSGTRIDCAVGLFWAEPGAYDVVVKNPDGQESRLPRGFTVSSACGAGGGAAVLMTGLALGLLSVAGMARARRRGR